MQLYLFLIIFYLLTNYSFADTDNTKPVGQINNKVIYKHIYGQQTDYVIEDKVKQHLKEQAKKIDRIVVIDIKEQPLSLFIDVLFGKIAYKIADKEILDEVITGKAENLGLNDALHKLLRPYHIYYTIQYDYIRDELFYMLYRYNEIFINAQKNFANINDVNKFIEKVKKDLLSTKGQIIYVQSKNVIHIKDYQSNIEKIEKILN